MIAMATSNSTSVNAREALIEPDLLWMNTAYHSRGRLPNIFSDFAAGADGKEHQANTYRFVNTGLQPGDSQQRRSKPF